MPANYWHTHCSDRCVQCHHCFHCCPAHPLTHRYLPWFLESVPSESCAKGGAGAYNTALQKDTHDPTGNVYVVGAGEKGAGGARDLATQHLSTTQEDTREPSPTTPSAAPGCSHKQFPHDSAFTHAAP